MYLVQKISLPIVDQMSFEKKKYPGGEEYVIDLGVEILWATFCMPDQHLALLPER